MRLWLEKSAVVLKGVQTFSGDFEITFVDLESGEGIDSELMRCDRRGANAQKGVE
jgi:hypothetical protein